MPNRILRESILTSKAVNQLTPEEEVFYRRLMSIVDDYGRFEADPEIILYKAYPLRTSADICEQMRATASKCEQMLATVSKVLMTNGESLVQIYEVDGRKYLQMNGFGSKPRSKPRFPDPPSGFKSGHLQADASNCVQMRADVCEKLPVPNTYTYTHSYCVSEKKSEVGLSDDHIARLREIHKHWPEDRLMDFDLVLQDWISRPQYAADPEDALTRLEFATQKYLNGRDVAKGVCCNLRTFIAGPKAKYLDINVEDLYEQLRLIEADRAANAAVRM